MSIASPHLRVDEEEGAVGVACLHNFGLALRDTLLVELVHHLPHLVDVRAGQADDAAGAAALLLVLLHQRAHFLGRVLIRLLAHEQRPDALQVGLAVCACARTSAGHAILTLLLVSPAGGWTTCAFMHSTPAC